MTTTTNAEKLLQYKIIFSLITEQTLVFASHSNMAKEIKILSPSFKQIA